MGATYKDHIGHNASVKYVQKYEGKAYITAGHTVGNGVGTGAKTSFYDEAVLAADLRDLICAHLKKNKVPFVKDDDSTTLRNLVKKLRAVVRDKDIVFDIHFNAATPKATGTEVFIDNTPTHFEEMFANEVAECMADTLEIRNRGVKSELMTRHKSLAIISTPSSACNVLIEVCFITNDSDMEKYESKKRVLAARLAHLIAYWMKRI